MAKIYPSQPSNGTSSGAERKVFHALKDKLPDEYVILHSLPVYKRVGRNNSLRDGEVDFVILHSEKGMLGIEVKGGGIECDSESGDWYSIDYRGEKHKIKNPYEQVKSHIHTLAKEVRGQTRLGRYDFPFGHAVWFPDLDLSGDFLGISVELKNITLEAADLQTPNESIKRLFNNSIGHSLARTPGNEGVEAFRKFYAPSKKITVSLSKKLEAEKEEILDATISQYKVLSFLERFNQALISGAAGTGKTYLALEKAKRIVENNPDSKVLIVCYNKPLFAYLASLVSEIRNIEVFNFHGLCIEMCRRAGMDAPKPDTLVENSTFFNTELPDALLDALDQIDDRYDAIIADEGQDFHDAWWMPLQLLLNDYNEGIFYIFFNRFRASGGLGSRKRKFRFKNKLLSLDSTTISLCLNLFPWATFRRAKGVLNPRLSKIKPAFFVRIC
jgi:hypothetical protein